LREHDGEWGSEEWRKLWRGGFCEAGRHGAFCVQRQMGLRSLLSRMAEEKTGREITKIGFDDISFSSLLCGLFFRTESVFITIARDLLSFGFSSLLCYEWKRDLSHSLMTVKCE
jgi:hypothetical protein